MLKIAKKLEALVTTVGRTAAWLTLFMVILTVERRGGVLILPHCCAVRNQAPSRYGRRALLQIAILTLRAHYRQHVPAPRPSVPFQLHSVTCSWTAAPSVRNRSDVGAGTHSIPIANTKVFHLEDHVFVGSK